MSRLLQLLLTAGLLLSVSCDEETQPAAEQVEDARAERAAAPEPDTSCADGCGLRARALQAECLEDGSEKRACGLEARTVASTCIRERCGEDAQPTTEASCTRECGLQARQSIPGCIEETQDEEACKVQARTDYAACAEACSP